MTDQGDQEQDQEQVEEDLGDASRSDCNATKTQQCCDQRYDKESHRPT